MELGSVTPDATQTKAFAKKKLLAKSTRIQKKESAAETGTIGSSLQSVKTSIDQSQYKFTI